MSISINCRDIGDECDHPLRGETLDELVAQAAVHAMTQYGCPEDYVSSEQWVDQMKAVFRNVGRPGSLRASEPPFAPPNTGGGA